MKKPRNKGQKSKTISSQCNEKCNQSSTPTEKENIHLPPKSKKRLARTGSAIWSAWKAVWAFVGPMVALTGFAFLMTPKISIEPGVNLDPSQPLATQFLITNRGNVPVYDISFSCKFNGQRGVHIGHMVIDSSTIKPVKTLSASSAVTRGCVVESANIDVQDIVITATYRWPIVGLSSEADAHFSIRKGAPGFFLVPGSP